MNGAFFFYTPTQEGALINQGKIMRRDVVATIGGLILVALVVVGTFLYGNSQREKQESQGQNQEQQKQTEQTEQQKQDQQKAEEQAQAQKKAQEQQQANEAKQKAAQQQAAQQKAAQQQAASSQNKPATVPQTGASAPMPETGGELFYIAGAAMTIYAVHLYRRSRMSLNAAAKAQS